MESPPITSTLSLLALWIAASWAWGRAFLPLSRHIFPGLLDGGLAAGRLLALVLVALLAFEGAALHIVSLQFSPLLVIGAPLLLQYFLRRDPARAAEFRGWAKARSRDLLASDAIFVLGWLLFAWIRLQNPALSDLEKPMDAGLLASATRASWLPFENWWMAGMPFTNYYYFAPLLGSLPTRALATPPHIAYNLVQPLFCAMFASILAALCASLCRPRADEKRLFSLWAWARGAWAMSIVSLLGNWEPLRQMQIAGRWLWPSELDWWKTSRVIEHTINEYPAFTQTTGDIHAHFYALSLAALLFSLAWSLFQTPQVLEQAPEAAPTRASAPATLQVLAAQNGSANGALNGSSHIEPAPAKTRSGKSKKRRSKSRAASAAASTSRAATATLEAPPAKAPPVEAPAVDDPAIEAGVEEDAVINAPTAPVSNLQAQQWRVEPHLRWARVLCLGALLGAFILGNTWDVPLYALLSLGCLCLSIDASGSKAARLVAFAQQAGAMLGLSILLALPYLVRFRSQVHGVQFERWRPDLIEWALMWSGIVGLALLSIWGARRVENSRRALWQVLALCGALALIAPSFFYIRGAFGDGPDRHQDTVFKFGIHAWLLLGTAGSCGVWWLLDALRPSARRVAVGAWGLAWAIPLLCTLGVVSMRTVAMKSPVAPSLNGAFPLEDAKAIAWLSANAPSNSVVLEAAKPDSDYYGYNEFGRVASLTGVPTPAGWTSHLGYWGADFGRDVVPRVQSIRAAWNAPDAESARAVLRPLAEGHDHVFIFIGEVERRTYSPQSIAMMRSLGRVAFDEGAAVVEVARK